MIGLPDNERDELRITLATGCKDSPAVVRSILLHAAGVIPVSKTIIASFSHTFLIKIRRFWVKNFDQIVINIHKPIRKFSGSKLLQVLIICIKSRIAGRDISNEEISPYKLCSRTGIYSLCDKGKFQKSLSYEYHVTTTWPPRDHHASNPRFSRTTHFK